MFSEDLNIVSGNLNILSRGLNIASIGLNIHSGAINIVSGGSNNDKNSLNKQFPKGFRLKNNIGTLLPMNFLSRYHI